MNVCNSIMGDHKQVLLDTILTFVKNLHQEIKEQKIELLYDNEPLEIEIKPKTYHFDQFCFGNSLVIESNDNYLIILDAEEFKLINLPTMSVSHDYITIKSPSYWDIIDILKSIDYVNASIPLNNQFSIDLESKYRSIDISYNFHELKKITVKYQYLVMWNPPNIDAISLIPFIKYDHIVLISYLSINISINDILKATQKANGKVTILTRFNESEWKQYICENLDKLPNYTKLQDIRISDYDNIPQAYNRDKYLDALNLRRLQLKFNKSTNLQHPLANKDIFKLIESFLY